MAKLIEKAGGTLKTNISSAWTQIFKFVFPLIWVVFFVFGTALMYYRHEPQASSFLLITLVGAAFLGVLFFKLVYVAMDDAALYVQGATRRAKIPFSEIVWVMQLSPINIKPAIIVFRNKTIFGRYVLFIPLRDRGLFRRDSVIDLLCEKLK